MNTVNRPVPSNGISFDTIALSQTNCYLLQTDEGYLLIDCGKETDALRLMKKLNALGLSPASIRALLLTHHHSDHCGLLHVLRSQNPSLKVIMSRRCAEILKTGRHCVPASEAYSSPALGAFFKAYLKISRNVSDQFTPYNGDINDLIIDKEQPAFTISGIQGLLVFTPGHTADSISLVVGEDAFAGDAARNILNGLGAPFKPILMDDADACVQTWKRLKTLGVKRVHPAHGKSFDIGCLPV